MSEQNNLKALTYLVATVFAGLLAIGIHLANVDFAPAFLGFLGDYFGFASQFGPILGIAFSFALVAGVGFGFYAVGYSLIYLAKFAVWAGDWVRSRKTNKEERA